MGYFCLYMAVCLFIFFDERFISADWRSKLRFFEWIVFLGRLRM